MAETVTTKGIVLNAMPIADYDKRLTILTKDFGKITVFAKGARRQNSRYMAGSMPFSFGEFTLFPGRDAYTLTGCNISEYFPDISADIDRMYYGFYILELADYFAIENTEGGEILRLVYITLKNLTKKVHNVALIRRIYELKILAINGIYPDVYKCLECGDKDNLVGMDFSGHGVICSKCRDKLALSDKAASYAELNTSTIYTMQFVISAPMEKLFSFTLTDEVLQEFSYVMNRLMHENVSKPMKSLDILNYT